MPDTSEGDPTTGTQPDRLAGFDVPRIRVEGAIVEALDALDKVSQRADALDPDRSHAVAQAVHAARLSMIEALRRGARTPSS